MEQFLIITGIIFVAGFLPLAGYWFGYREWRSKYDAMMKARDTWWELHGEEVQRRIRLENSFDHEVEKAVEKRIRQWTPDLNMAKEDFTLAEQMAEYMALNRKTIDAGRKYPPRPDQTGENARVIRTRRIRRR